ncbi:MAG: amidase family protein [Acidimicrobiales bacterium]|nr:amidase family protein [Acidimicrobiales bacterium]
MDFRRTTVAALVDDVVAKRISSRELVDIALARIDEVDPQVNAFVAVDGDRARADAAALDERIAAGEEVGPLTGIPIGVKDLEDAIGFPTSQGSAVYADGPPATSDSALVDRMRAAGCIVVGKTNTPELGFKGDTTNPRFGITCNPWDLGRSAGGSSGGSAAAIAAGMVPLCTGSDGGGSIRTPSSVCGLSGLKPSLGRVPMGGSAPPSWGDLSTRGPMARRIRDIALALDAVVGPEPTDLRTLPMPEGSWSRSLDDVHAPRRIGWAPTLGYAKVDSEILALCEAAMARFAALGAEIVHVDPVFPNDPVGPWLTLAMTSNLRQLGHLKGTDLWARLDPDHTAMMEAFGATTSGTDVIAAIDACHVANVRLVELFHKVPLICTPTVAGQTPTPNGLGTIDGEGTPNWVSFTYPFNMTRSPAGTVCVGLTGDGLPVGLQIVGPQHGDVAVLRGLTFLEDALALDPIAPL